ncbi:MAG: ferredoxin [Candidatus Atribacteria bacterium]|nr:ferredoxin [Candidatus Atribacteria bacterium]
MANLSKRTSLNVAGKYYVDFTCICCGICTLIAPLNFFINLNEEYGYICKQPETKEEIKAIEEAIQNCPVEAIGSDGEEL